MKKLTVILVTLAMVFSLASSAGADSALDKLGRGLANTLTGIFEIPKNMGEESHEHGYFAGFTTGLLKGITAFLVREVVGVYEVAMFPIPLPAGYKPILPNPEYLPEYSIPRDTDY